MTEPVDRILSADETGEMQGRNSSADFYRLRASHEALRARVAAAHDVIRRLRDGWEPDIPVLGPEVWCWFHPDHDEPEPLTEAERDILNASKNCGRPVGAYWCVRPPDHDGECNRAYRSGQPTTGAGAVLDAAAGPDDTEENP